MRSNSMESVQIADLVRLEKLTKSARRELSDRIETRKNAARESKEEKKKKA